MNFASLDKKHNIVFDDSGQEASLKFLRKKSTRTLKELVSARGNKVAYAHYLWSHFDAKASAEEFWSEKLSKLSWSTELEQKINDVKTYLSKQDESKWLNEVLRYLPPEHFFKTTAYLNLGYDHIVFGEDIALNLNSHQFNMDKRESVYYLIHELAHAGYVRYHPLPQLWDIKTNGELLKVAKFLTHLEGMGVLSALRLRILEGGLLDNDYKTLLNSSEKSRRINQYFMLFNKLKRDLNKKISEPLAQFFDTMSGRKTRLWYITGCYMAQEIEKRQGNESLGKLVKQGSEEFFNTYLEFADKLGN